MAGLLAAPRRRRVAEDLAAWFADPLDGLHDPALLPDAGPAPGPAAPRPRPRRAGPRLRRLRRRRPDRAGDHDPRPAPVRRRGRAVRAEPARRGPRPVARRDRRGRRRRCDGHRHRRLRDDQRRRDRGRRTRAASTSSSRTTTASRPVLPAALAIVNPHRPDSTYPDRRLAGSGVAFKVAQLLLADEPGGPAAALDLADLATIGTVADVAPDRRREPGDRAARARAAAARAAPRDRGAPRAGPDRARRGRPRDRRRSPSRRASTPPAGWGRRSRPPGSCSPTDAAEAATPRRCPRGGQPDPPRPDEGGGRRGPRRRRRRRRPTPRRVVRGPWSVGIVGLVAARLAEDRGRPAVVGADLGDVVRASCRSDGSLDLGATLERCADLFIRYGGHAGAAGFELADRSLGRVPRRGSWPLAASRAPPDPRPSLRDRPGAPGASTSTTRLYRELAGLRRAARATPTRSSPSSA